MSTTHTKSRACEKRDVYFTTTTEPMAWTMTDASTVSASNGHTIMNTEYWSFPIRNDSRYWMFQTGTDSTEKIPLMDVQARRQNKAIAEHIYMMENKLDHFEQRLRDLETVQPRVVMLREIDEPTAEREIVNYLQTHGEADTADLVEKLGIDIDLVLSVVQRLKNQGSVERVVDSHESR